MKQTTKSQFAVSGRRPRIWAIGISRLRELYRDLASSYDDVADIRLLERGFDGALEAISAAGAERPDVIVSAGANGNYVKSRTDIPVVLVSATGFDVMQALGRARRESEKIALVMHGEMPTEASRFLAAFGFDIVTMCYATTQDAENCVLDLRDAGVQVVVGPGLVTELADNFGMRSVFLYSQGSVRTALDNALNLARAVRAEGMRRRRLDQVLANLRDGVVALDEAGRVEAISGKMASILGVPASQAVGKPLAELSPEVASAVPRMSGEASETINGITYAVHRHEWDEAGQGTGAVVTFVESLALQRMNNSLRSGQRVRQFTARYTIDDLLGNSNVIKKIRGRVRQYAASDATTLVTGATGTGKEIVAQSIHNLSARRRHAFVAINCGAFPDTLLESELFGYEDGAFTGARRGGKMGLIESAHQGTLFLDEIAEMPLALQSRLLRVIQEREVVRLGSTDPVKVDVRIITATHGALKARVDEGTFRADLFYRVNVLTIEMPPLSERLEDLPLLARHLLKHMRPNWTSSEIDTSLQPILGLLTGYAWPGNVRELYNVMERLALALPAPGRSIDVEQLCELMPEMTELAHPMPLKGSGQRHEIDRVRKVLTSFDGDRDKTCEVLGISRTTLWRKLNQR
ncbi:propionate catabolism operon regulatory protein PrpR [Paraburkholderia caledonica]|uniref:propionate catabolism operon regulatory protein PrpR n=1 Tax=Paraburkholderia caledonica TaxID=134536 RepID=UPI0004855B3B|nr:propionate catabolism operon regulatory protein PrpR [Paraburkholderia caledonica]